MSFNPEVERLRTQIGVHHGGFQDVEDINSEDAPSLDTREFSADSSGQKTKR